MSEVGFGGGGIGRVWGETTDAESVGAIHRAIELGVNFFDVAPGYGAGKAEEVLGEALIENRHDVSITTKVSMPPDAFGDAAGYVRQSLEGSLKRLRTDYVDLLLVHNTISSITGHPFSGSITAAQALEMADEFKKQQQAGKVRFIGFTAWRCNERELLKMLDSGAFDAIQTEYNILNQSAMLPAANDPEAVDIGALETQSEVNPKAYSYVPVDQHLPIPRAVERDMGVIVIRPVLAGVLSHEIDREVEEWTRLGVMTGRASALKFLHTDNRTLAGAAFTFCLMNPNISTIVPGVKNAVEIEEAISRSGAGPLTEDEMQKISDLYGRNFQVE